jgi:hypothetical protein
MPTDCNAIVATVIRLCKERGMISDTYEPLAGKSIPIPTPIGNWPTTINEGSRAITQCGAGDDDRHVHDERALAAYPISGDSAQYRSEHRPKDQS